VFGAQGIAIAVGKRAHNVKIERDERQALRPALSLLFWLEIQS
jgi:hypothetical protein